MSKNLFELHPGLKKWFNSPTESLKDIQLSHGFDDPISINFSRVGENIRTISLPEIRSMDHYTDVISEVTVMDFLEIMDKEKPLGIIPLAYKNSAYTHDRQRVLIDLHIEDRGYYMHTYYMNPAWFIPYGRICRKPPRINLGGFKGIRK